jgi:hypothetical protein
LAAAGVASSPQCFRAAAQRFLRAAAMRRRATGRAMRLGASSRANVAVLSKPCGPVISTGTLPRGGSATIQPSCGWAKCFPPASTAASMRSRRVAEIPLQSKTVSGSEAVHLGDQMDGGNAHCIGRR